MADLFKLINSWQKEWQIIFLIAVLWAFCALVKRMAYYFVVLIKGWPIQEIDEEENDEEEGD